MSIFNVDFDQKAVELLPPDKRFKVHVGWVRSLLSQNQYNHTDIFVDYKTGSTYPLWNNLGSWNKGQRVIYGQSVYESLVDNNTDLPTNTNTWRVYQTFFIGTDERIMYNSQKLVLEYALNRKFGTTFRQPPLISDIFINLPVQAVNPFVVAENEEESSDVFTTFSSEFILDVYSFSVTASFDYTINVPQAVYDALSIDPLARDKIIRQFVDRYNTAGMFYNIITY